MTWVLNNDLTDDYIQSLRARCGFTDVTATWNETNGSDWTYVIIDLDGTNHCFSDLSSARGFLIQQYVLIQNS